MRNPPVGLLRLVCIVAIAAPGLSVPLRAQSSQTNVSALERLVGGSWHLGEDSYHVFSWGVGRQSVKAQSYFVTPEGERLVSETTYFYHPGRQALMAYSVAVDMGIDVFEYTSIEASGDTLIFDLRAYGPSAPDGPLRETWTFLDDDHYQWVLWAPDDGGGWTRSMEGTYQRR